MTYLALNALFVGICIVPAAIFFKKRDWILAGILSVPLLVLTAFFDNAIIGFGIVGYDAQKISGVMIGLAPIEDFAYTIVAVLLIPVVWKLVGRGSK